MAVKGYAAKQPKGKLEPIEFDPGPLGPDEVEVRVECCGVCHSDIAMIDNDWGWTEYPLVPGHEVVGTIAAVGAEVHGRAIGERVGIGWHCGSCGHCEWCNHGREGLCAQGRQTVIHHRGGWAESVRCQSKFAVPIPEAIDSAEAGPLMCAGTTVFTPLVQFGVKPWMRAAVLGIGGLGHLAVQFLARMGCEVTAISSSHDKDDDARKLGASRFIATRGGDELKRAAGSFDIIVSTVSADVPWVDYVTALRPTGRLIVVGIPTSDLKFPVGPMLAERSVSGGSAGGPTDTALMLDFAARAGVRPLIERFPMAEVNAALDRVRSGKVRFRAVLVA
jgi:uncharacterized zinc-type alcohol dehydrogenase-like protein